MGRPMAANLVKAGHEVSVWNRTPREVEGATTASTPAEAVKSKEAVWVCVSDTKAVQAVLFSPLPPACFSWKDCRKKAASFLTRR